VPSREVQLTEGGPVTANLALPSVKTLRHALCPAAEADTALGVMLGTVRRTDGSAVAGAAVVFQWTEPSIDRKTLVARSTRMTASTTTDSVGVYRACGLPTVTTLLVQAQHGREQSGIVDERIGEAAVLVREIVLGDTARAAAIAGNVDASSPQRADTISVHGAGVVHGVVLGEFSLPIGRAQVRLFGTSRSATTDAQGEFRLADVPTGTQGFEIVALGYLPRRFRADVTANTPMVRMTMNKIATVLDSMRIVASRRQYGDRYREFDDRKRLGVGQYITLDDIQRKHPFVTTDLLRQMSGFAVVGGRDGRQTLAQNRGVSTLLGMTGSATGTACPQVFLDGVPTSLDIDEIPPNVIYGIEVYRGGQEPPRYGGHCGAILIWTR
jgi:hypothetical protein